MDRIARVYARREEHRSATGTLCRVDGRLDSLRIECLPVADCAIAANIEERLRRSGGMRCAGGAKRRNTGERRPCSGPLQDVSTIQNAIQRRIDKESLPISAR